MTVLQLLLSSVLSLQPANVWHLDITYEMNRIGSRYAPSLGSATEKRDTAIEKKTQLARCVNVAA
jgi:hypothetical protein